MVAWKSKGSVVAVASAAASLAAVAYEFEHRRVSQAVLAEQHVRIQRLWDLLPERESLEAIGAGLEAEWGATAFVGFGSVVEMASKAGRTIFVARRTLDDGEVQTAVLQTIRVPAGGDPARLVELFPTFADLTAAQSWRRAARKGGDTLVLLQITTLGRQERGAGLGSLLRNAALHMQPSDVKFALTTTPIDDAPAGGLHLDDASTFTGAMRFHMRGGATPAAVLPGYRAMDSSEVSRHGSDVIVMRYARLDDGSWPVERPQMRLRRTGPVQQRLTLAWRRLRRVRRGGRRAKARRTPTPQGS